MLVLVLGVAYTPYILIFITAVYKRFILGDNFLMISLQIHGLSSPTLLEDLETIC